MNDALRLAENIARMRMTVTVRRYCYSSCANYIIAAGKQALLEEGSIIILHGDAETTRPKTHQTDIDEEALAAIDSIVRREQMYRSRNPRAQLIHDLQLVARGPKNQPIQITQGDLDTVCYGMGLGAWSPSGKLLLQLSLIDQILTEPGVSFTDEGKGIPPGVTLLTKSPLRECSPAPSPIDFD